MGVKGRFAGFAGHPQLDLPPLPVVYRIAWLVSNDVVLTQFAANGGGDFRDFLSLIGGNCAAVARLGDVNQQTVANLLVEGFEDRNRHTIENPDGINEHIGFLNQALRFPRHVTAVIVLAIRNNEQGTPLISCAPHLGDTQVDSIEQSGIPGRRDQCQLALDVVERFGRVSNELGMVGQADYKIIVLWIGILEEFTDRRALGINLIGHAVADIENQADGNGFVLRCEVTDLLWRIVFGNSEVLFLQIHHRAIHLVSHGGRHHHEVDINFQAI